MKGGGGIFSEFTPVSVSMMGAVDSQGHCSFLVKVSRAKKEQKKVEKEKASTNKAKPL